MVDQVEINPIETGKEFPYELPPLGNLQAQPIFNGASLILVVGIDNYATLDLQTLIEGEVSACSKRFEDLVYLSLKFKHSEPNEFSLECPLYAGLDPNAVKSFRTFNVDGDLFHWPLMIVAVNNSSKKVLQMRAITVPPAVSGPVVSILKEQVTEPKPFMLVLDQQSRVYDLTFEEHTKDLEWYKCGKS